MKMSKDIEFIQKRKESRRYCRIKPRYTQAVEPMEGLPEIVWEARIMFERKRLKRHAIVSMPNSGELSEGTRTYTIRVRRRKNADINRAIGLNWVFNVLVMVVGAGSVQVQRSSRCIIQFRSNRTSRCFSIPPPPDSLHILGAV